MSYFIKFIRYIYYTVMINYYCNKYGVSKEKAKSLAENKLVNRKKRLIANKLLKMMLKRKILLASLAVTLVFSIILAFGWYGTNIISIEQTAAISSNALTAYGNNETGEYTIFTGNAICDIDGKGGIAIPASLLNNYNVECNGKFALKVLYTSHENYSLESDRQKTIFALEHNDRQLSNGNEACAVLPSDDTVERSEAYNESSYLSLTGVTELELTQDETEYEIALQSSANDILENGTFITGYNWEISRVVIVDIEKRNAWKFNSVASSNTSTGGTTADGTLAPQSRWLQNWYGLFKDLEEACNYTDPALIRPEAMVGTILRESYNIGWKSEINSDTWSYNGDLTALYPSDMLTEKASGEITQETNNGWAQYNKTTWETARTLYGTGNVGAPLTLDSETNLYRPNCWYGHDHMWSTVMHNSSILTKEAWQTISSDATFQSIDDIDKSFIFGFMNEVYHNRGGGKLNEEVPSALKLANIASNKSSYGISNLYEMSDAAGISVWSAGDRSRDIDPSYLGAGISGETTNNHRASYDRIFALNFDTGNGAKRYQEYAYIDALCGGYKCYNSMMELITADSPTGSNGGEAGGAGGNAQEQFLNMAKTVWDVWYVEIPEATGTNEWYFKRNIRTATYGTVRADCSGYVSTVLWQLGYIDNPLGKTTSYYYSNPLGFEEVTGGLDAMQPGDIIVWTYADAHMQIYAGKNDNGERLWYSWGSNGCVQAGGPSTRTNTNVNRHLSGAKIFRLNR